MSRLPRATAAAAAVGAVGLGVHALPALAVRRPFRQLLPGLAGLGTEGTVAVTFDDGPDPRVTPRLLDVLAELGWPATFFMLGERCQREGALARRVVTEGHDVGLHGQTHRQLMKMSPAAAMRDLRVGSANIAAATGRSPTWFRPTYGALTGASLVACLFLRLRPVLWTSESGDWLPGCDASSITRRVVDSIGHGGTVLFHDAVQPRVGVPRDGPAGTVLALRMLADEFAHRRLRVVPLAEHLCR